MPPPPLSCQVAAGHPVEIPSHARENYTATPLNPTLAPLPLGVRCARPCPLRESLRPDRSIPSERKENLRVGRSGLRHRGRTRILRRSLVLRDAGLPTMDFVSPLLFQAREPQPGEIPSHPLSPMFLNCLSTVAPPTACYPRGEFLHRHCCIYRGRRPCASVVRGGMPFTTKPGRGALYWQPLPPTRRTPQQESAPQGARENHGSPSPWPARESRMPPFRSGRQSGLEPEQGVVVSVPHAVRSGRERATALRRRLSWPCRQRQLGVGSRGTVPFDGADPCAVVPGRAWPTTRGEHPCGCVGDSAVLA